MLGMTGSFMLVELIVGYFTNSMALVADSFHMLSDVVALLIALVCIRISPKEWSKNTFGWARAEVVGALVNSVFLLALCFSISVEAIQRFLDKDLSIDDPQLIMIVGGVGLAINLIGLFLFGEVGHGHSHHNHSHGGDAGEGHSHDGESLDTEDSKKKSQGASGRQMNITGVFLHVLADALGSVVVMISASVIWLTDWQYRYYLDPVLSLLIVCIICVSTWPLLRDSTLILLNSIPSHINLMDLEKRLISSVEGVVSVHELHIWRLVGTRVVASCHLSLSQPGGEDPIKYNMKVARQVKEFFHREGIHSTTIQLESGPESGLCQLECPSPDQESQEGLSSDCLESSCCRERLSHSTTRGA